MKNFSNLSVYKFLKKRSEKFSANFSRGNFLENIKKFLRNFCNKKKSRGKILM